MFTRKSFLAGSAAGLGLASIPSLIHAADDAPLGTWPAGSQGNSVFVGIVCDLTGPYSADGEDQRRGYELVIDHINNNTGVAALMPGLKGKKGVLGKKVEYKIGDTETKADPAVQRCTEYITQNKAVMIAGGVSTAVAIALEKLAQQQKVLYFVGASGSNDTTGKDCQRYGFRMQPSAYMAAKALAPVLGKNLGMKRKAAYLIPDYSYGRTVFASMKMFTEKLGWQTVNETVCPVGATDYSSYLTNIANSPADVFVNVTFGTDSIASTKQAAQFGISKKMKLVVPNISTFMPDGVGADIMEGVYGTMDWYYRLEDKYPLSKVFVETFQKKYGELPRWTAHEAYMQTLIWADAVTRANTFYPPSVIKQLEKQQPMPSTLGTVYYRAGDHQLVRPVPVLVGKKASAMKNKADFFDVVDVVDGKDLVPPLSETGCTMPAYT